jgi:hypothetical protein
MTAINWSRPLMTNAGKPARREGTSLGGNGYFVVADFGGGCEQIAAFFLDGKGCNIAETLRNATPAEVLAHPDVWPEHRDWANNQLLNNRDWPAYYAELERREPDGVYVTREAWDSAIKKLDEDWSWRELEVALGMPPAPPKVAPWEAAFREWEALGMTDAPHWAVWKAAWAACEQHYNIIGE